MRRALKLSLAALTGMALTLGTAACGGEDVGGGSGGGKDTLKVGLAFDIGGRGDQSFNDAAAAGLDRVKKELNIQSEEISAKEGESEADKESRIRLLANRGYDPVIGVGFIYTKSVIKVAKEFPDTRFLVVDPDQCKVSGTNVQGACFAEEEGSFLVGAAAGLKTETDKVGFIGGVNVPLIHKFQAGFEAGAKQANPNVEILPAKYLTQPPDFDGFKNPALGREAAQGMLDGGADVIYHAAGGAGIGVIKTVGGAGKWAIGVDSDQYKQPALKSVQKQILTSMLKRVDVAVYDFVKSLSEDTFKAGIKQYSLKNNGVGYATSGGNVDDIKADLEKIKADIVAGKITVPSKPE